MNKDIVVIGSSNTDMIIKMQRIPAPGETVLGGTFATAAGGKGANQAVAAARAGGQVTFIVRIGNDMFGEEALIGFINDGINCQYLMRDPSAPSGVASIFVDENGQNSIAVASGANAHLSPVDIHTAQDVIASAAIVLMQLEIPIATVETAARIAAENKVPVILNPAPAHELSDELLSNVSIITPNEIEAEMLTGIKVTDAATAEQAAKILIGRGLETAIITMGDKGAYVVSPDYEVMIDAFDVKAVDATAAGDVFNGVLSVCLAEGESITDAARIASAASAISVTKLGAQTSAPTREQIKAFLKK